MNTLLGSSLACALLSLARCAEASSFQPECTIPPPGTSYVSGPNTRGTTAILFNCLSIIFLCTWNIQHLNVPAGRPLAKNAIQGIWWAILDSRTKIKWMIITILFPEYLIGKAFGDRLAAEAGVRMMKSTKPCASTTELEMEVLNTVKSLQWDRIHVYMANMGYFVVDFGEALNDRQGKSDGVS
jgi:hypothetical protein